MNDSSNMNTNSLQKKTIRNLLWRFAERCGAQLVSLVVSIVLARLLEPEAYGIVALITVIITILQVFVESGLGSALIQKKGADKLDYSTVFIFNIGMSLVIYAVLYIIAPYLALFYENSEISLMIRVLGTTLLFYAVRNVQQAYVSKHLMFKQYFFATLVGTVTAAIVGISIAYMGGGAWSLVIQQITNTVVGTVALFCAVKWKPQWHFSWTRFKQLFSFGWKLLISGLINTGYNNLRQLIIGKIYTNEDLAFYNQGDKYPLALITAINSTIDAVLFPVMSSEQDHLERLKLMTRRAIKTSSFILWPIMLGLAAVAKTFVSVLLTDKWLPCVPYMQALAISYAFWPIHTANLNAINALGRSDIYMKLEILKKSFGIAVICISVFCFDSPIVIALSSILTGFISLLINAFPNRKLLNYGLIEQIKDIAPSICLAMVMAGVVLLMGYLPISKVFLLFLQIIVGGIIYIGLSFLLKVDSFFYLCNIVKGFVRKENTV